MQSYYTYAIYGNMCNRVTYPVLRCVLGYTNDPTTSPLVSLYDIWHSSVFTNILACLCSTMVYKLIEGYTNATCHQYAQHYCPLAYRRFIAGSTHVSRIIN